MRRAVLVLAWTFALLGTAFTISPEFLEHSPIGFEQRGVVHHGFHYLILIGGFTLLIGIWSRDPLLEVLGLWGCGLPVALNLAALLTAENLANESGIDIALRVVLLALVIDRLLDLREAGR